MRYDESVLRNNRNLVRFHQLLRLLAAFAVLKIIDWLATFIPYSRQGFFCEDIEIRYPDVDDTVDPNLMKLTFVIVGVILVVSVELALIRSLTASRSYRLVLEKTAPVHPGLYSILFLLTSIFCNYLAISVVTELGKRTASRLRPNFLAVCKPNLDELCPYGERGYVASYVCHGKDSEDEYFSFPSGHSAQAVGYAVFIIYYVQKRCRFAVPLGAFVQLALSLYAFFVCLSRIRDHKHRLSDVCGGAAVGASVAFFFIHFIMRGLSDHRYAMEKIGEHIVETRQLSPPAVLVRDTRRKSANANGASEYGSIDVV